MTHLSYFAELKTKFLFVELLITFSASVQECSKAGSCEAAASMEFQAYGISRPSRDSSRRL